MIVSKEMMQTKLQDVWRINGWQLSPGGVFAAVSSEAYLLFGPPHILIDCGSQLTFDKVLSNLETLKINLTDIELIIGTHSHWDHIGAVSQFKKVAPISFAIHEDDANEARKGFHDDLSPNIFGPKAEPDIELTDGQVIEIGRRKINIIHTPGHSRGSISIHTTSTTGKKLLFTGDAVHGIYSTKSAAERKVDVWSELKEWATRLEYLRSFDFDFMFEGHVMPAMSNITILSEDEKKSYVNNLLNDMEDARKGAEDGKEKIEKRIFLLKQGLIHLPDYYISEACAKAGFE